MRPINDRCPSFGVDESLSTSETTPVLIELTGEDLWKLNDGIFNFALSDNTAVDWAVLDLGVEDLSAFDLGDAPSPYATLRVDDGARHFAAGPMLGTVRDIEVDGQPSANADGDGADEDGVLFGSVGADRSIAALNVQLDGASEAKVDAWVDFNFDGDWDDAGEQIFSSVTIDQPLQTLNYMLPTGLSAGDTFARVRISSQGGLSPTGFAIDGEVEDYKVTIDASVSPVEVESIAINNGTSNRSELTSVQVTFNQRVTANADAFELNYRDFDSTTVTQVPISNIDVSGPDDSSGKSVFTITFLPGAYVQTRQMQPHSLVDGNYDLKVIADKVRGVDSLLLPMESDYVFGDSESDQFFRYYGSQDGTRTIDFSNYGPFGLTFRAKVGEANYDPSFDLTGDGDVDFFDFGEFGQRFRQRMDWN